MARLAAFALALFAAAAPAAAQAPAQAPARVVSMNLCTDQLAMLVAAPGQLVSVSHVARDPVSSAMAEAAAAYPVNHASAEEIFLLRPDLVLAGAWDRPVTLAALDRLGLRVETFGVEAGFADIRANVTRMGALLGRNERAAALVAGMDAALARVDPREGAPPLAALLYANAYTSGAGTLADEILRAAGYANLADERGLTGMARLPLETLVLAAPDLLVTGQDYATPARAQEALRHPAARALGGGRAAIADNLWVCGTPLAAGAVAALRAARP